MGENNGECSKAQENECPLRFKRILDHYGKGRKIDWVNFKLVTKKTRFISNITIIQAFSLTNDGYIEILPERRFIVKELPKNPDKCSTVAFKNEHFAYGELLPLLDKCSPSAKIPRPEIVYISDHLLMFDDLTFSNYKHYEKLGYSVPIVQRILIEIANFHSASLVMKHENPTKFNEVIAKLHEVVFNSEDNLSDIQAVVTSQEDAIETALNLLKGEAIPDEKAIKLVEDLKGRTFKVQKSALKDREDSPIQVITHGDLWNNNFLINDESDQFKFIDFQAMRHTSVAADLSYFFYVNLDPDFRLANLTNFLEFYLAEMLKNCAGKCPTDNLTLPILQAEMEEFKLFGLISAAWVLPALYQPNSENDENAPIPDEEALAATESSKNDRLVRLVKSCVEGATVSEPPPIIVVKDESGTSPKVQSPKKSSDSFPETNQSPKLLKLADKEKDPST